jgi:hypothetical protein
MARAPRRPPALGPGAASAHRRVGSNRGQDLDFVHFPWRDGLRRWGTGCDGTWYTPPIEVALAACEGEPHTNNRPGAARSEETLSRNARVAFRASNSLILLRYRGPQLAAPWTQRTRLGRKSVVPLRGVAHDFVSKSHYSRRPCRHHPRQVPSTSRSFVPRICTGSHSECSIFGKTCSSSQSYGGTPGSSRRSNWCVGSGPASGQTRWHP